MAPRDISVKTRKEELVSASCQRDVCGRPVAALAMNLQLLEPAIAPPLCEAHQWCASRSDRLAISLFAVWLFATAGFALAPQKSITQFTHTVWTEKDGAPADIVAITQTSDGYLCLRTPTGLFSFDGIRFAHFEPRAGEDLPAKAIRNQLATRDGSLWIVFTSGDTYRLREGERQHVMRGMRAEVQYGRTAIRNQI